MGGWKKQYFFLWAFSIRLLGLVLLNHFPVPLSPLMRFWYSINFTNTLLMAAFLTCHFWFSCILLVAVAFVGAAKVFWGLRVCYFCHLIQWFMELSYILFGTMVEVSSKWCGVYLGVFCLCFFLCIFLLSFGAAYISVIMGIFLRLSPLEVILWFFCQK